MHWDYGWHMTGMWLLWLVGILLLVAVVWLAVRAASGQGTTVPPRSREDSAEEILRRRYAKGEIDKDEYQRRMDDIRR
jgi:putative membrane protein